MSGAPHLTAGEMRSLLELVAKLQDQIPPGQQVEICAGAMVIGRRPNCCRCGGSGQEPLAPASSQEKPE